MRSFIIRQGAQKDVSSASDYLKEIDSSLSSQFLAEIKHCFDQVELFPHSFPVYFDSVRVAVLSKLSYKIFYRVYADKILILALTHTSQNSSEKIKGRL